MTQSLKKTVIVISDCHLSAGPHYQGRQNPYEDFKYDDEMCSFFEAFSEADYLNHEVELILNGDFLDFLNVPIMGEFPDAITEAIAVQKLEAILEGHPKVFNSLKKFASLQSKSITYLVGNHDAELFFPKVYQRLTKELDPEGRFPSPKVKILVKNSSYQVCKDIEIHHGNQFESVHVLNFENPTLKEGLLEPVLNIPWGSFYVLKVLNHFKEERDFIDKIRPIKIFIFFGLLFDTWFTLKFCFLSAFYFLKTRFFYSRKRKASLGVTLKIISEQSDLFQDLEKEAREVLNQKKELKCIIFGHTHFPMDKRYADGKQYINTGTWTRMIHLDLRRLGQSTQLTFAKIEIDESGIGKAELRRWTGEQGAHSIFQL